MKLPATSTMKVYFNVGIILAVMMMMTMTALQQKTDTCTTFDCSQKKFFDVPDFTDKSHFLVFRCFWSTNTLVLTFLQKNYFHGYILLYFFPVWASSFNDLFSPGGLILKRTSRLPVSTRKKQPRPRQVPRNARTMTWIQIQLFNSI